jgi:hypothetical protein
LISGSTVMEWKLGFEPLNSSVSFWSPVQVADLARLQAHRAGRAIGVLILRHAHVDVEGLDVGLSGRDGDLFQHQAAGLRPDGGDRGSFAAKRDGDAVVALRHGEGEEERLVRRADAVSDGRGGVQVEAGERVEDLRGGRQRYLTALRWAAGVGDSAGERRRWWCP